MWPCLKNKSKAAVLKCGKSVCFCPVQYSEEANLIEECEQAERLGAVDESLRWFDLQVFCFSSSQLTGKRNNAIFLIWSEETQKAVLQWTKHDDSSDSFCEVDGMFVPSDALRENQPAPFFSPPLLLPHFPPPSPSPPLPSFSCIKHWTQALDVLGKSFTRAAPDAAPQFFSVNFKISVLTVWRVLRKLNIDSYDLAVAFLVCNSEELRKTQAKVDQCSVRRGTR